MQKIVDITPDPSLFSKVGRQNYTVATALAELCDNSIDAMTKGSTLKIDININHKEGNIFISDNGPGMNERMASDSLRLGLSVKNEKLGSFGMGLKASTMYLGKHFVLRTTQKGSEEEFLLNFNEDDWLKKGTWKCEMSVKKGAPKNQSGTSIAISKLKVKLHDKMPSRVRSNLAMRFSPFIEKGGVTITVNNEICKPEQPSLLKTEERLDGKQEIKLTLESGYKVTGWVGILEKGGANTGQYGFRTFHRNRLIDPYAKVGFAEHPQHRKIIGELYLDHVPVTNNKSSFMKEDFRWQELNDKDGIFWKWMIPITKEARQLAEKRKITETTIKELDRKTSLLLKVLKDKVSVHKLPLPEEVSLVVRDIGKDAPLSTSHIDEKKCLHIVLNAHVPGYKEYGLLRICSEIVTTAGEINQNQLSYHQGDQLVGKLVTLYVNELQKQKELKSIEDRIAAEEKKRNEILQS